MTLVFHGLANSHAGLGARSRSVWQRVFQAMPGQICVYEIIEQIGSGPRATVYLGRHVELRREVAIKQLHPTLTPKAKQWLLESVSQWAKISDDHLLRVRDIDPPRDWVILDLMRGSFAQRIAQRAVPPRLVQDALGRCLLALERLHSHHQVLHANIKPSNILLDDQDRSYLCDGYLTPIGSSLELPQPPNCKYLAPEMLGEGAEEIGPAADLYCLGFVMLEMLSGPGFNAKFRGVADNLGEQDRAWIRWHTEHSELAPRAADCAPDVPRSLAVVIDRLVDKDLVQRYRCARDALNELETSQPLTSGADFSPAPHFGATPYTPTSPAPPVMAPSPPLPPGDAAGAPTTARPATSVLLWIISGPRAGEIVGSDNTDICVSEDIQSELRFSVDQYPGIAGRSLLLRREADGWMAQFEGKSGLIVNRRLVQQSTPLRSGDILRISLAGPDFQFILQSPNEQPLAALAAAFLKPQQPAAPNYPPPGQPAAEAGRVVLAPPTPDPPVSMGRDLAHAASHKEPNSKRTGSARVDIVAPPTPAPVRKQPRGSSKNKAAVADSPWKKRLDYRKWNKKTQNWVVGVIATIIALVVVYFVPTGGAKTEPTPPSRSGAQDSTNREHDKGGAAVD